MLLGAFIRLHYCWHREKTTKIIYYFLQTVTNLWFISNLFNLIDLFDFVKMAVTIVRDLALAWQMAL